MSRWVLVTVAVFSARLGAQVPGAGTTVPDGYRPPAGMCRIWIDNVPPDRQPAPTDCATAVRRRPANAKVIFGDLSKADEPSTTSTGANGAAANSQAAHEQQAEPAKPNENVHPAPPAAPGTPAVQGSSPRPAKPTPGPVGPPSRVPAHAVPPPHAAGRSAPNAAPPPAPKGGGRPPSHHGSF